MATHQNAARAKLARYCRSPSAVMVHIGTQPVIIKKKRVVFFESANRLSPCNKNKRSVLRDSSQCRRTLPIVLASWLQRCSASD
jgi:hypothetical protein